MCVFLALLWKNDGDFTVSYKYQMMSKVIFNLIFRVDFWWENIAMILNLSRFYVKIKDQLSFQQGEYALLDQLKDYSQKEIFPLHHFGSLVT
jgi:hypothetical protein